MKPGDLVVLSSRKTRKGYVFEDQVGLVLEINPLKSFGNITSIITVDFGGVSYDFGILDLELVSEGG
jgi:hypothetical protein|tara:strand:+ start:29719 stop:29919 length:201 start_codon:yes stop_codon:yes gene_type:complete